MGKTNYILQALVEKGLVRVDRFAHSKNKLNYCYNLTPEGLKQRIELTEKFIQRKQQEYQILSDELENLQGTNAELWIFNVELKTLKIKH